MKALWSMCFVLLTLVPGLSFGEKPCQEFLTELEKYAPSETPSTQMQIMYQFNHAQRAQQGLEWLRHTNTIRAEELREALSPANKDKRRANDPRLRTLWGRGTDAANPHTIKLKKDLAKVTKNISILNDQLALENAFKELMQVAASETITSTKDLQILEWLGRRSRIALNAVYQDSVNLIRESASPLTQFNEHGLTEDIQLFLTYFDRPARSINPLQEKYERFVRSVLLDYEGQTVNKVLNRKVKPPFLRQLKLTSVSLCKSLKEYAAYFGEIDAFLVSAVEEKPSKVRRYVHDLTVVSLARTGAEHKVEAAKIAQLFLEIEEEIAKLYNNTYLEHPAVAILVEVAVTHKLSAEDVVERMVEINHLRNEKTDKYEIEDIDLARLVEFSFAHNQTAVFTIEEFISIHKIADRKLSSIELYNYVVVEIMHLVQQVGADELNKILKNMDKFETLVFLSTDKIELLDRDIFHLVRLAQKYNIPKKRMRKTFARIYRHDKNLNDATMLNILEIALQTKQNAALFDEEGRIAPFTDSELLEVIERVRRANIPHFDWFYWTATKQMEEEDTQGMQSHLSSRPVEEIYDYDNDFVAPSELTSHYTDEGPTQYAITGTLTNLDGNPFTTY